MISMVDNEDSPNTASYTIFRNGCLLISTIAGLSCNEKRVDVEVWGKVGIRHERASTGQAEPREMQIW
jgi:hypothetical protein